MPGGETKVKHWTRRKVMKAGASAAALSAAVPMAIASSSSLSVAAASDESARPYFAERGYYITFMRSPLFTLTTWKRILDAVKQDGGNLVILWMGGAFPSRKFPITWKYNAEHENIKHNFAGALIDYAHTLGLKVLLGLTPFGYDGVNQYAIEHPELKAVTENGNYTKEFGLDAWGFNLNPYLPEAQQFMLQYTRELLEFYPHADGLFLESSDYAISYCAECPETYYQKEFRFVRQISEELWATKPEATIVIYPHYFSGVEVPGMKTKAAKEKFDPRWSLFFTPHSTHLSIDLIKQARSSLYWSPSPTFGRPKLIQEAALTAGQAGCTGFVPSFEPWNFVFTGPDLGESFLIGKRASPFGFGWLKPGENPANELLMRLDRMAYREFARDPNLAMEDFRPMVSRELFAGQTTTQLLDDLFFLEESFFLDRNWDSISPIASPDTVKGRIELGLLGPARLREYRERRVRIQKIADRYATAAEAGTAELGRTAHWIVTQWNASPNREVIDEHLRG
jgi:hypothetical protein